VAILLITLGRQLDLDAIASIAEGLKIVAEFPARLR
jgi:hypothetical protein